MMKTVLILTLTAAVLVLFVPRITADEGHGNGDGHEDPFLGEFAEFLGIATLSLVLLTVLSGAFRKKSPRFLLRWHKRIAYTALVTGLCHGTIMLFFH